jgi:alpha-soluble NSF attachment protein
MEQDEIVIEEEPTEKINPADGDKAIELGEKKLKGSCMDTLMCKSKADKADDAVAEFDKAARCYKYCKRYDDSAKAYLRIAKIGEEFKQPDRQSEALINAANMQTKTNKTNAIENMNKVIDIYCKTGRIVDAGQVTVGVAELYESEKNWEMAVKNYKKANEYFEMESGHDAKAYDKLLKAADILSVQDGVDLAEPIQMYEKIADKWEENKLAAWSCKDLYFKCCLLYLLLDDTVGALNAVVKYGQKHLRFNMSKEQNLIKELIPVVENKETEAFNDICYNFQQTSKMDTWLTTIFTKLKAKMEFKPAFEVQ